MAFSGTTAVVKISTTVVQCLVSNVFNANRDVIEVTNQLSTSGAKEYVAGEKLYEIQLEGLVDPADTYGAMDLLSAAVGKTSVAWTIGRLATVGAVTLAGSGYVSSWSMNFPKNAPTTFSATIRVTSAVTPGTQGSPGVTLPTSTGTVNSGTAVLLTHNSNVLAAQVGGGINVTVDMIDVTNKSSANSDKEFLPGEYTFEIPFEGLITESTDQDGFDMLALLQSGDIDAFLVNLSANDLSGNAMVTGVSISAPKNNVISYSGTLKGTGALSIA